MPSTIAVTGASGFIATELVAQLLARGDTVRGTVRSLAPERTAHLTSLPGASERLTLFAADLLDGAGAFAEAFAGCSVVMHTACPFVPLGRAKELGEEFFVKPAVDGTHNILAAVATTGSVRRVVMTSSTAAIFKRLVPDNHVYSESDWNDTAELRERSMWYSIGKTRQEEAAWAWMKAETRSFDLACINPTMVAGRMRQPGINASNETVLEYCNGSKALIPNGCMPWVHVKDVAAAHIAAAETPAAGGQRYMMIAWWGHLAEQCAALRKAAPGLKGIPSEVDLKEGEAMAAPKGQDSSKVTRELGIQLRGLEECMADSVASLIEHGLVGVE